MELWLVFVSGIGLYGGFAIGYLLVKLLAAARYRPFEGPAPALRVAAVIPFYNEDPDAFRTCLRALLCQSRPLDEIWVIDDGSKSRACHQVAVETLGMSPSAQVIRCDNNRGKRHAQSEVFRLSQADVFLLSDSDTVFDPDAVQEGLKPFRDPEIQAVCGNISCLNRDENLLTWLLNRALIGSMERVRAAHTVLDSVPVASGAMSFYRAPVIRENLDAYVGQTFLGAPVVSGDDSTLTNFALERGRVVIQLTAKAETKMPSTISGFLKQQIRWSRNFIRGACYAAAHLSPKRVVWWFKLFNALHSSTFGIFIIGLSLVSPPAAVNFFLLYVLAHLLVTTWLRRSDPSPESGNLLLAPIFSLLHATLLSPLRLYALLTVRDKSWVSRNV